MPIKPRNRSGRTRREEPFYGGAQPAAGADTRLLQSLLNSFPAESTFKDWDKDSRPPVFPAPFQKGFYAQVPMKMETAYRTHTGGKANIVPESAWPKIPESPVEEFDDVIIMDDKPCMLISDLEVSEHDVRNIRLMVAMAMQMDIKTLAIVG